MTNFKQLLVFAILGYVCYLALNYIESILGSLFKIIGLILNVDSNVYVFLDVIPRFLIILLWILIIFKYLKSFSWNETLGNNIPKNVGIKVVIILVSLFILNAGIRFTENTLWPGKSNYNEISHDIFMIKSYVQVGLNFIEFLLIIGAVIKLINIKEPINLNDVAKN